MKSIIQLSQNKEYKHWVKELKKRYLTARLKASVEANRSLMEYYWSLGRDISDRQYANTYGSAFYATLSHDLKTEMPGEKGFSVTNLKNMYYFYRLYSQLIENRQQPADDLKKEIFSIPWDHQCRIVSKCKEDPQKALFYVRKTIENNWGRDMLLNFLKTDCTKDQVKLFLISIPRFRHYKAI